MACPLGFKHYLWVDYMIAPDLEACHSVWTILTLLLYSPFVSTDGGNKFLIGCGPLQPTILDIQVYKA